MTTEPRIVAHGSGYCLSHPDVVDWVDRRYPHASVLPDGRWMATEATAPELCLGAVSPDSTVAVFSSDAAYYPGLVVALASFKRYHPDIHTVILDCGLTTPQARHLGQFAEIRPAGGYVPEFLSWARFEVSCLPYRRIIYLDSDVVVLSRLEALLLTESAFAVVRNLDWQVRANFKSGAMLARYGVDAGAPAFNAGVFALDNLAWGNGRLLHEALDVWTALRDDCIYPDQSILHVVMYAKGHIDFIEDAYNAIAEFWDWRQLGSPRLVHFAGDEIKPWHPGCAYPGLEHFFRYSKIVRDKIAERP
jgi:hypothetical protein